MRLPDSTCSKVEIPSSGFTLSVADVDTAAPGSRGSEIADRWWHNTRRAIVLRLPHHVPHNASHDVVTKSMSSDKQQLRRTPHCGKRPIGPPCIVSQCKNDSSYEIER